MENNCVYEFFSKELNFFFLKIKKKMRLGVACSGGPDSILILYFLKKYQKEYPEKIESIVIIHIIDGLEQVYTETKDFIREAEEIVYKAAKECDFTLEIRRAETSKEFALKNSFEALCHKIRKKYFIEIKTKLKLDRILTGHNKDDQIEHFFIALIRKSSIRRICGMKRDSGFYFRPLLEIEKKHILDILKKMKKKFAIDPCNNSSLSLRNNIRYNLIPVLKNIDSRAIESILFFCQEIRNYENYFINETEHLFNNSEKQYYQLSFLKKLPFFMQQKIIEKICYIISPKQDIIISRKQITEILRFLFNSKKNRHIVSNIYIIDKKKDNWQISIKK